MPQVSAHVERRGKRIYAKIPISLIVNSQGSRATHHAHTIDLSHLGVRVRSQTPLKLGQNIEVIPSIGSNDAVPSRVVWVGETGSYRDGEAGLEFLNPFPGPV